MDHSEIQSRINALPAAMNAKGLSQPNVEFVLEANDKSTLRLRWQKAGSDRYLDCDYEWIRGDGNDPALLLNQAVAFINALPSVEEKRKSDFMASLAKLIEQGKGAHIEVELVNPLVTLMKKLSENAITHQRGNIGLEAGR